MKIVRLISDGWRTHLEIDGKHIGEDIKSVVFTHDVTGEQSGGYKHPVLQLINDKGIAFDSRFDTELPDYEIGAGKSFDEFERMMIEDSNANETADDNWQTFE